MGPVLDTADSEAALRSMSVGSPSSIWFEHACVVLASVDQRGGSRCPRVLPC